MALTRGELARKLVHMGVGLIAFALRFLGPLWSAVLAAVALANNLFVLPRVGGKKLWRENELATGSSIGIILYPFCVLLLILIYWKKLEVAAATWGILAFGDGMASIVGMAVGRAKLPWNPKKSWAGTFAYLIFGTAAAAVLLQWTAWPLQPAGAPWPYSWTFAVAVAFGAALVAALLESIPQGLDDNLGVPLVSSLVLCGLVLTEGHWSGFLAMEGLTARIVWAAVVNAALAGLAYALRTVDISGVIGGFVVGFTIWLFLDWEGFLLLLAFFVIGSACTKLGYKRKAAQNLAQEKGGRRGARHAFANAGVAMACALFAGLTDYPILFALAFAASFATAAADTASSEIGQLLGKRTYLVTTFRPVPRGTEGAVSLEGTLAGVAASLVIGALGALLGLYPWTGVLPIAIAAFVGTTFESVVGAALEKRQLLDNEALNFLNTLVGALVAAVFTPWVV